MKLKNAMGGEGEGITYIMYDLTFIQPYCSLWIFVDYFKLKIICADVLVFLC